MIHYKLYGRLYPRIHEFIKDCPIEVEDYGFFKRHYIVITDEIATILKLLDPELDIRVIPKNIGA